SEPSTTRARRTRRCSCLQFTASLWRRYGGRAAARGQRSKPAARCGVRLPAAAKSDEMSDDKAPKMKSSYELALERLAGQGIEPPREEALSPEVRQRVAEARQKTEAKLAELEILH